MICTFECTFCIQCVENILVKVCPICGGSFEKRATQQNIFAKFDGNIFPFLNPYDFDNGAFSSMLYVKLNH